ncbi:MAG: LacI family DNA-binding transcriptional regulator [Pseudomonadota bacterium]
MTNFAKRRTLREVADAAGVSEMTVSRVLRGNGVVSNRTRDHVLAVVDKLGYVQNRLAGSLAAARSNQVAVVIPSLVNNVFTEVTSGITSELEKAGYNAVIGVSDYDLEKEEELIYSMMSWRPSGIIVPNTVHTEKATNILKNAGVPVVETMNLTDTPIDIVVGLDQRMAARALAQYVLSKGYRRFAAVGWTDQDHGAAMRFSEIEAQVNEAGFEIFSPALFDRPPNFVRGKAGLAQVMEMRPDIDAVFFSNDTAATGGIIHCLEAGVSIPDDLAIAGFSGLETGQHMPKRLCTIRTRRFEIGRLAAKNVLNRLAGVAGPNAFNTGFELLEGNTV